MEISNSWSKIVALQLLSLLTARGAQNVHIPVALEGYIRDERGKPVEGVLVSVSEGSYTTQGETAVIPLISQKTLGAIVINDPDITNTHYYNTHFTKSDAKGHFVFKSLSPTRYKFSARGMKKYAGDMFTHENSLVENKKLLAEYAFPPAEVITINGGETITKNIVLHPSKLAAVCAVPKPRELEDAKFIDGFAAKAAKGNKEALRMLGYAYQGEHGVAADRSQAVCWFRKAAAKGDQEAEVSLQRLGESIY